MLEYYPLIRVGEYASTLRVSQGEKKHWTYTLNDGALVVETDHAHNILTINYTPELKSLGLSLKRAQKKGTRVCRYVGH